MAMENGEAIQVLTESLQSSAGRARLDANTPNTAESAALTKLTGSTLDLKHSLVTIKQAAADMPTNASALLALLSTDEWDDFVTVITT